MSFLAVVWENLKDYFSMNSHNNCHRIYFNCINMAFNATAPDLFKTNEYKLHCTGNANISKGKFSCSCKTDRGGSCGSSSLFASCAWSLLMKE